MKLYRITLFCCLAGPVVASFVLPPPPIAGEAHQDDSLLFHLPCCLFRSVTSLPCPFCGLTRSFVSLAHGRFRDAWLYHPLGPPLFLAFALGAAAQLVRFRRPEPERPMTPSKPARWGVWSGVLLAALFALTWIAKLLFVSKAYW